MRCHLQVQTCVKSVSIFLCDRVLRLTCRKQKEEGCGRHEKNEILKHAKRPITVVCAMKSKNIMYDLKSHKAKKRNQNQ